MLDPALQTILYDQNARYFGYSLGKLMEEAGKGLAEEIIKKYPKAQKIAFFCGTGNNGGDGFVAARYLGEKASVFIVGDEKAIKTEEARRNWKRLKNLKTKKRPQITQINIRKDFVDKQTSCGFCARMMAQKSCFDVVVDCLLGTGVKGKLRKPYDQIVKLLNGLKAKKVACDIPTKGFKADLVVSMMFPKVPGAVTVDIAYPETLKEKIGAGEVKALYKPSGISHKGDNGKLLIIGGSERFHGAALLAAQAASKFVDLVYFSSVPENNALLKKMKSKLCEFIAVPRAEVLKFIPKADVILVGPGLGTGEEEKGLVEKILQKYPRKKIVLDADALTMGCKSLLHENYILTPHKKEFQKLFGVSATKEKVRKMAKKHKCTIVLKGKQDYVADAEQLKVNLTGNAGMTKGGTGDLLAGLIAALYCTNEAFLAASAGVFLNGLAGDRLQKKVSTYFSASDLVKELPRARKFCDEF